MKYLLDAQALLNVIPFVCTDTTRYNIQAVQIRANRIWATNGHLAIAHKLEQMDARNLPVGVSPIELSTTFCIQIEDVKKVTAFVKAVVKDAPRGTDAYCAFDTETGVLSDVKGSTSLNLPLYDGEFPDFLKVIPKPATLQPISHINVSGGYVGQLAALVGKGSLGVVEIYGTGGLREPMIVRPMSGAWLAVVMPCTLSKDDEAAKEALEDLHADLKGEARPARLTAAEKEEAERREVFNTLKDKALSDHTDRLERGVCPVTARTVLIGDLKTAKKVLENGGLHPEDIMALVVDVTCDLNCPSLDCPDDLRHARTDTKDDNTTNDTYTALNNAADEDDEDALPPAVTQTALTDDELALVEYALTPYEGD